MMKSIVFLVALIAFCVAVQPKVEIHINEDELVVNERFVNHINSKATSWVASTDQGRISTMTKAEARRLMGAKKGGPKLPRITHKRKNIQVPDQFDWRERLPYCTSIHTIRDQSACGSCWAFGSVEAMSDRYCVAMNKNISISSQDLNSCCDSCGDGCNGGYPSAAWSYWASTGLVSETCAPYSLPSCNHHEPQLPNPCPSDEYPTPACPTNCSNGDEWQNDLHFGTNTNSVSGEDDMMAEIYQNGSGTVSFTVYSDFLSYKSGVYQYTGGSELGGHAVKVLGWGVENGLKYWLCANSWNPNWGDHGYFKILRGVDECGIEDEMDFGTPAS